MIKFLLGAVLVLISIALPFVALAHNASVWLTGYWGPLVACDGQVCRSLCDLVDLGQHLTAFGITLVIFAIAPVMVVYGGVKMMMSAGSPEGIKQGRGIILNAVIGIAIALGAYIIISTFLLVMGIATGGTGVQWPNIQCTPQG